MRHTPLTPKPATRQPTKVEEDGPYLPTNKEWEGCDPPGLRVFWRLYRSFLVAEQPRWRRRIFALRMLADDRLISVSRRRGLKSHPTCELILPGGRSGKKTKIYQLVVVVGMEYRSKEEDVVEKSTQS